MSALILPNKGTNETKWLSTHQHHFIKGHFNDTYIKR